MCLSTLSCTVRSKILAVISVLQQDRENQAEEAKRPHLDPNVRNVPPPPPPGPSYPGGDPGQRNDISRSQLARSPIILAPDEREIIRISQERKSPGAALVSQSREVSRSPGERVVSQSGIPDPRSPHSSLPLQPTSQYYQTGDSCASPGRHWTTAK